MMKGLLVLATAIAALCVAGTATAAAPDPGACANITGGGAFYNGAEDLVAGNVQTAEPSCRSVTYTIYVVLYDESGQRIGTLSQKRQGTGETVITGFAFSDVTAAYVCAYATSGRGTTLYDIALSGGQPCPSSFDPAAGVPTNVQPADGGVGAGGGFE
jgi:hypothetical protein